MDKPSIGRIVHFRTGYDDGKPCAALIVDVDRKESDNPILLQIFTHDGGRFSEGFSDVPGEKNHQGHWWEWPQRG